MASSIYFMLMGVPRGIHTKTQWTSDGFVCFISVHTCIHSHTVHAFLQTHTQFNSLCKTLCLLFGVTFLAFKDKEQDIECDCVASQWSDLKTQSIKAIVCFKTDCIARFWHFPKPWQLLHVESSGSQHCWEAIIITVFSVIFLPITSHF